MVEKIRKGQVAIWVILGVVLIAAIVLFFLFIPEPTVTGPVDESVVFDMQSFISVCTRSAVLEAVDIMLPQGGFIDPQNTKLFDNIEIEYLCENTGNYLPCISQHPLLLNDMEAEIEAFVTPRLSACFLEMQNEFEKTVSSVEFDEFEPDVLVDLGTERINVLITKKVTIGRLQESRTFETVAVDIIHPAYDIASVAMEIAAQEAEYCYFEYVGFKILYPRFTINKYVLSDSTKIYRITDESSGDVMNVAMRGCAIPPGF